jgi:hypothetical protein
VELICDDIDPVVSNVKHTSTDLDETKAEASAMFTNNSFNRGAWRLSLFNSCKPS